MDFQHCARGQHENRNGIGTKRFEGSIGDETEFVIQRSVDYWAELRPSLKLDYFRKRERLTDLDAKSPQESWIYINTGEFMLDGPIRATVPPPPSELHCIKLILYRLDGLKKQPQLTPALFFITIRRPPISTLFPDTTLFR